MIEFALGAYLATRPAVTAIVGATDGIFGDKARQKKEPPFIVHEQVGGEKFYHSTGASGLAEAAIQITCRSTSYVKTHQLYEVLRNELDGFSGTWGSTTVRSAFLSEPTNASVPATNLATADSQWALQGTLTVHYFRTEPTN